VCACACVCVVRWALLPRQLVEMHETLMQQKADKTQLERIEHHLSTLRAPPQQLPAGTRAAPLHERLLVAHAAAPIVAEARDQPGSRFIPRQHAPPTSLRRPASASSLPRTRPSSATLDGAQPRELQRELPRDLRQSASAAPPARSMAVTGSDGRYYRVSPAENLTL